MNHNISAKRIPHFFFLPAIALLLPTFTEAAENKSDDTTDWQTFANCAAGYRGNWQSRRDDEDRSQEMGAMILELSDEYKKVAVMRYRESMQSSQTEAEQTVNNFIKANVDNYVAMDKEGKLIPFLDTCPQTGEVE